MHSHRIAITQPLAGLCAFLRIIICGNLACKSVCVQRCLGTNQIGPAPLARSVWRVGRALHAMGANHRGRQQEVRDRVRRVDIISLCIPLPSQRSTAEFHRTSKA